MRPSSAPLTRTHSCRCGQTHPSETMVAGMPVLRCPDTDGLALQFVTEYIEVTVVNDKEKRKTITCMPYLVTGFAAPTPRIDILAADMRAMSDEIRELREAVAKRKGKE